MCKGVAWRVREREEGRGRGEREPVYGAVKGKAGVPGSLALRDAMSMRLREGVIMTLSQVAQGSVGCDTLPVRVLSGCLLRSSASIRARVPYAPLPTDMQTADSTRTHARARTQAFE